MFWPSAVNSKRYGIHERSPRGAYAEAVLNEVMEACKSRLLEVYKTASLFLSGIRGEHGDGSLWPCLLGDTEKGPSMENLEHASFSGKPARYFPRS